MYTQQNIIQPGERKDILSFATTSTDFEGIMLREISQRDQKQTTNKKPNYMV